MSEVGQGLASGSAVFVLASLCFTFYRYVWKPQQDRMDAFVARSETTLEARLTKAEEKLAKAEARIDGLETEIEQCHADRRLEQEHNARMRLALISAGIDLPDP